jgi:O-antigen/teichoic acid export membrane protein
MTKEKYSSIFIKQLTTVLAGNGILYVKSLLLIPMVIKSSGINTYGTYILISSLLSTLYGVSSLGAGYKMRRFLPAQKDIESRRNIFFPQFYFQLLSLTSFSVIFLLSDPFLRIFIFKNQVEYNSILIPIFLYSYFLYAQSSDYFRYTSRILYMNILNTSYPYLHLILLIIGISIGYTSVNSILLTEIFSLSIIGSFGLICIAKETGLVIKLYKFKDLCADIKIGFPLTLNFFVEMFLSLGSRYIIAYFLNVRDVGIYNLALTVGSLSTFIPKSVGTILPQLMVKSFDRGMKRTSDLLVESSAKVVLLISIPYVGGCYVISKLLLTLLSNDLIAEESYTLTTIISIGAVFTVLSMICSNILFVQMRTNRILKISVIVSIINLLLFVVMLTFYRTLWSVAVATVFCQIINFLMYYASIKREYSDFIKAHIILKEIISMGIMMGVTFLIIYMLRGQSTLIKLLSGTLIGICTYVFVILRFQIIKKDELTTISNCMQNK